jgi:hypothetical protein
MSIPTWDEVAEDQFWEQVPQDLHENAVKDYLGSSGDAIDQRVLGLIEVADQLFQNGHYGPSIVTSTIGLEVMIQYFCVRPIVQGAMLSDLLAAEISKRIVASRSSDQRAMLSAVVKPWGINLPQLLLPGGLPLWDRVQTIVVKKRDAFVHRGDGVSAAEAQLGLDCVRSFRDQVVLGLANRLGFTIPITGCWSKVIHNPIPGVTLGGEKSYGTINPFAE